MPVDDRRTYDAEGVEIIADAEQVLGAVLKGRRAKPVERPYIFCDTREQQVLRFPPELGVDCGTAKLDAGDYSVRQFSHCFIAERKSAQDLIGTLSQGRERFLNELDLLTQYRFAVILVEANQMDIEAGAYRSAMNPKSVMGSLDAIWMKYGVVTRWCGNAAGAAKQLAWYAHRLHKRHADMKETPTNEP